MRKVCSQEWGSTIITTTQIKKKLQLYLLGEPRLDIGEFKIVYNILKLLMISQPNGEFNFGKIADGLQSTSLYLDKLNK